MKLRTLPKLGDLKGKRVLLRVDFNVPVSKGKVESDGQWRLRRSIPTLEFLRKAGAKVLIISHRGRPAGKKVSSLSMKPIAKRLSSMLSHDVVFVPDCTGKIVEKKVASMQNGDVLLLENLRFKRGEAKNDKAFAKRLAEHADLFVNDAFAVAHREAASVIGVTKHLPSFAGLLMQEEVASITGAMKHPKHPFIAIMGGAKVSSKIGVIEKMLEVADRVLLGGALIIPFFEAQGFGVGGGKSSQEDIDAAVKLMCSRRFSKIVLPHDLILGNAKSKKGRPRVVELTEDPIELTEKRTESILDIGPKTISAYSSYIRSAQTIMWNGPLGLFEIPKYSHGSLAIGRLVAARSKGRAFGIVGGGETVMALERTGLANCVDHISTGGGAMLDFIQSGDLPGLEPLKKKP